MAGSFGSILKIHETYTWNIYDLKFIANSVYIEVASKVQVIRNLN